eukprot:m.33367 g.33367  ORF g.33367 m.33367 type:complete len:349 (+) comp7184_c0_seq2:7171-8217(+)
MPVRSKCQCRCASLILIEDESRSVDVKVDRATLARSQISTGTETLGLSAMDQFHPLPEGYHSGPPMVQVWFGDPSERELHPADMYLAVYAAGGGKRNMANFVRQMSSSDFRTSDVHIFLSSDGADINVGNSRFFICRWASARGEWVPKEIMSWSGESQFKLVPEWFKARFWDNKQEKKHPWFMFALLTETDGMTQLFTSNSFPVHQYYPTGVKKTDPNDAACRAAFHKVLKAAPPTSLRPEHLLKRVGDVGDVKRRPSAAGALPSPPLSAARSPTGAGEFWASDDMVSDREETMEETRKRKLAASGAHQFIGWDVRSQRSKMEVCEELPMETVAAADVLLTLRWDLFR